MTTNPSDILAQTGDILSGDTGKFQEAIAYLTTWGAEYGLRVIGAFLTLIVGWLLARFLSQTVAKWLRGAKHVDNTVADYVGNFVRIILLIITAIAVLAKFGVETASFVGVISAASLAIGLALQGTLANFAAGLMLLLFRPFKESDLVEIGGQTGTVQEIGIFATEIRPVSGEFVLIPNGQIWGTTIINYTRNGARRFDLEIGIDYGANQLDAQERLMKITLEHPEVLEIPEPVVTTRDLGDNAVVIGISAWTKSGSHLITRREILSQVKVHFDEVGIGFPFPQRDVNLVAGSPIAIEIVKSDQNA